MRHVAALFCKSFNDPIAFWTMTLAIFTLLLFIVAWWQLSKISKTSSADFIHKLKIDFFSKEARELILLHCCPD
jgi:hypothetical protein